jgi:hypothetical protein
VEVRNALTVLLDGTPWPQQDEPQDLLGARSPPSPKACRPTCSAAVPTCARPNCACATA